MDKKIFAVLLVLFFIPAVISGDELEVKIDNEVFEELDESKTVEVIVVLDDNSEVKVSKNDIKLSDNKWTTSDEKISVDDVAVTQTYSAALNGFAAEVTESGLEELEQNENVQRIYYNQMYQIALQDSIPQISASNVHDLQINNIDLKGVGQTICLIDTGVNYNHLDLGGCFGDGCKVVSGYDFCADGVNCTEEDTDPMDVVGHGTHVAGIAAANGSITGAAPEANIVAIKAFNDNGATKAAKILEGLDWCMNNASEFDISVIVMSLSLMNSETGKEVIFTSNSDCDEYGDFGVVNASNNAASQGILVAAAAGNDGDSTGIGSPACGSNVTSVSSVTDSDAVYTSHNRGPILDLLAPGVNINSTSVSGEYVTKSGTSMATPHVAGAAAILFQIAELEGATVTAQEVEDALKDNGEQISEGENSYSRVDVLAAANSFIYPVITYVGEYDSGSVITPGTTLNFTAEDISGIDAFWCNEGGEYSVSETEWAVDADWAEGEYDVVFYANDTNGNIANITHNYIVDTAPVLNSWTWHNSTGSYDNNGDIRIDEGDTLYVYIDVTDADVYDDLTYSWTQDDYEIGTDQNLTYKLGLHNASSYELAVTISDGYLGNKYYWNLTVDDPYPPLWNDIPDLVANTSDWSYDLSVHVNNTDEDVLTYYRYPPSGFSIGYSTGILTETYDCDDADDHEVKVRVSDGTNIAITTFKVTVEETCDTGGDDSEDEEEVDDEDLDGGLGGGGGGGGLGGGLSGSDDDDDDEESSGNDSSDEDTKEDTSYGLAGRFADLDIDLTENRKEIGIAIAALSVSCLGYGFWRNKRRSGMHFDITNLTGYFKKK